MKLSQSTLLHTADIISLSKEQNLEYFIWNLHYYIITLRFHYQLWEWIFSFANGNSYIEWNRNYK